MLLLLFFSHVHTDLTHSAALVLDAHGQLIVAGLNRTQLHPVGLGVDPTAQPRHWKVRIQDEHV